MENSNPIRSVIITGPGFQDEEYVYPYYRLLEAGHQLDVAIKDQAQVLGKYGVPARPTMDTKDLDAANFDLVLLPGGFEAPDRVRLDESVLRFVREMDEAGKCIAAICHGPWICISAGILQGRRITAYQSIRCDIQNAGAEYLEKGLVIDGNLISAPHYKNNPEFMKATVDYFENKRGK